MGTVALNDGNDSFLVENCGLNLDAALEEFAASAPPGIYSRDILEVCACVLVLCLVFLLS